MLQAKQVLNERYQLKHKLGNNACRQTWLAEDLKTQTKEPVVVKLLAFCGDVQWDNLKLFEREAQVLKQLNHPKIPKYRDYFSIDDQTLWFGLVQEYIPGVSLKEQLDQGKKFSPQEIRRIALEVLNILLYLHQLSPVLLHRDIKPSNLICGENNQVYLVDFGAVQDRAAAEGATFTVVGTYGYAPLEQFGGRAVPASDLYALGATLIHLLTGTAPADLPQKDLRIQFKDKVSLNSNFLIWLEQLTEPALEKRFSSAREALEALKVPKIPTTPKIEVLPTIPLTFTNNSGCGSLFDSSVSVPDEIKGWNWGAFLLSGFWPLSNRVGIGLLAWVPNVGFLMAIALGVKGNEWAWKSRKWRSIEHFKAHQRGWAIAGIMMGIPMTLILWGLAYFVMTSLF
ncbi:MAG: serine/threonine protein kinase [Microcoleus vaginatus WJT46-NPBG5]|jgi:serine/threonine protein kinase|nr:serine/threonine protein kinase [Microcoleus vaginatus WJT46-NPBG5]